MVPSLCSMSRAHAWSGGLQQQTYSKIGEISEVTLACYGLHGAAVVVTRAIPQRCREALALCHVSINSRSDKY